MSKKKKKKEKKNNQFGNGDDNEEMREAQMKGVKKDGRAKKRKRDKIKRPSAWAGYVRGKACGRVCVGAKGD